MAFGIYVHWPFCAAKCPYCDFNSHVRTEIDEPGWLDAIEKELDWTAAAQPASTPVAIATAAAISRPSSRASLFAMLLPSAAVAGHSGAA